MSYIDQLNIYKLKLNCQSGSPWSLRVAKQRDHKLWGIRITAVPILVKLIWELVKPIINRYHELLDAMYILPVMQVPS